jgi:endonuclease/exonuclease/phosphatase family metal-dependent hydrolase
VRSRALDSAAVATVVMVVILLGVVTALLVLTHGSGPERPPSGTPGPTSTPTVPPVSPSATTAPGPTRPPDPGPPPETCVSGGEQTRLTFVTFNIHSAREHDGSVHLAAIASELARWRADVILLQEVDRGRLWSGRIDMPALLADRLGMAWTFGANVRRSATNQYGTAILSRYPIESSSNLPLPAPPGTQQRGLLRATIDVGGTRMSVYVTHLENSSPDARVQQIDAIAPVLRADPRPKMLGGDFNSVSTSPVMATARRVLSDTWTAVGSGSGLTAPGGNPRVRIDYLLYGGGSGADLTPLQARVIPSLVSDHRALRATYRLSTGGGEVCVPVLPEQTGS